MKKTSHIFLLTCVLGSFVSSCSDEHTYTPGSDEGKGITLMIPAMTEFSTRADDNATSAELRCTSLTFFAFPQNGKGEKVVKELEQSDGRLTENPIYKGYNIQVKAGTYHFYLVANHTVANTSGITEEELEEEIIRYSDDYDGTIPDGGIPMSCLHTEMRVSDGSTAPSPLQEAGYEIKLTEASSGGVQATGNGVRLYADLTFACSKITIRSANIENVAAPVFSGIVVKNISAGSPLFGRVNGGFDYGKINAVNIGAEGEEVSFYLPERYTASGADQSEAAFTIGGKELKLPLGEDAGLSEEEGLLEVPEGNRTLRRGYHYVYTLSPTAAQPVLLDVEPWTVENLTYSIGGPFFLHLDKTKCPVTAGIETAIWFDTDAPGGISVESPEVTVGGETLPLYTWRVNETGDSLKVRVNPAISSAYYNELEQNQDKEAYSHFHVKAGNLHKRVEVNPLTLELYLNVTPQTLSIDVREQIASGNYSGAFPFIIDTNYHSYRIERGTGWTGGDDGFTSELTEGSDYTLQLQDDDGNSARIGDDGLISKSNGLNTYRIAFGQLNSGKATWKKNRTLTLIVTAINDNGDPAVDGAGNQIRREVTVNVIPNLQNYIIHFYAKGWSWTHMYAYQCLELPSDAVKHPNQPLAVNSEGKTAALEYSFTGKIAFKGWNVGDYNDPNAHLDGPVKGFYYFTDQTYSWNPSDASCSAHYYMDFDFCSEHRERIASRCQQCNDDRYNKLWPGIQMENEGEGWWRFELTGVAVPGKTLLMFNNGHGEGDRFPGTEKVGIPLFDFPDREGWLVYNGIESDYAGNYFRSEDPWFRKGDKVTVMWKDSSRNYAHLWSELGANDQDITTWPGIQAIIVDGYNSVTVDVSYRSATIGYKLSNAGNNGTEDRFLNASNASSSVKIPTGTHYTFIL